MSDLIGGRMVGVEAPGRKATVISKPGPSAPLVREIEDEPKKAKVGEVVLDGAKLTPEQWDKLYSVKSPLLPVAIPPAPVWLYKWNLCTSCGGPIHTLCKHNPHGLQAYWSKTR